MTCVFCQIADGSIPAQVVWDGDDIVAFLDTRPVFYGHTLVVPRDHIESLTDLGDDLLFSLFSVARELAAAMPAGLGADGTFVGLNNKVSQSVPHVHVHVIPRRFRDGLRGFFWPRRKYEDDGHMAEVAESIRNALALD